MFEYNSTDEMVGKKLKDIFISDIRENFVFINTFFNSNYKLVEGKTTVNPKEGSTRYISHNLVGIVENSFLVRAWGTSTNITEKLKLEEEIMKSQKLESLGILAGGLAHDFNNLLTGILGNISLAKMYSTPDEKLFKRLTEAEKASFRAKDLTFQLMTFSKGGAPIKKTIDLKKTLRETTEFTLSGSKSKALIDISEDLWTVDCDEGQISQVISNLVINADQAMPDGGIINIKAQNVDFKDDSGNLIINQGRYVYISVEDNGDGIKSENLSKIFDPFFTTKPKGKGLGLTSVYSIIKRHNGYIDVDSETGTGTIFNIYLPASSGRQDIPIESTSDLKKGYGKILLMDDEEMIRDLGLNLLAEMGYEVDTSNDGLEAINKYKESLLNEKYRAVILDLTVPGGVGGTEAAKQIFDMDKEAKILVSSGYSNDPVMSNYRAYGFSGIIPKPYRTEELNSILDNVLNYSNH
jgi:signal transduction histidine kinase/CheY-like chemotaxis protein